MTQPDDGRPRLVHQEDGRPVAMTQPLDTLFETLPEDWYHGWHAQTP